MIRRLFDRAPIVALLYLLLTIVMTWPIAAGLGRDVPGDLGDPAFVSGVMAWGADHWLALLGGDLGAASRFWDAPFFAPEPMAIVYSEHLALHSLLTLPFYAATHNPVLCYNVWFLSTFVLSGLGMYLLVRELTGQSSAAFVAGLAYAFAPYRIGSVAHLQVLSSQWMPFVFFGLRRYFGSLNTDALLGAGAALWAQNLSSGYYMMFFGPFVALYALVEMVTRRMLGQLRVWIPLIVTAIAATAATLPFAAPYLIKHTATARTLREVINYSADLKGWLSASQFMNVWGWLHPFVKPEGLLFPGVTVVVLAIAGLWRSWTLGLRRPRPSDEAITTALPIVPGPPIQSPQQGARVAAVFGTLTLVLSFWLSLGPQIELETQPTGFPSLYKLAFTYVPGVNAARAPARFAMITVVALSLLAGVGLAAFDTPRRRKYLVVAAALLIVEGSAFPLPVNGTWTSAPEEFVPPEARLHRLDDAPLVYRFLSRLDGPVVVLHFPFALPEREIQYSYYAMLHGKRIVNGYSGAFPFFYSTVAQTFRAPLGDPATVHHLIGTLRTTHIVVHTLAYVGNRGLPVVAMLEREGWHRVADFDGDYVLEKDPLNAGR
jgi:hypothetical protein